jgi:hypothetical protein
MPKLYDIMTDETLTERSSIVDRLVADALSTLCFSEGPALSRRSEPMVRLAHNANDNVGYSRYAVARLVRAYWAAWVKA